MTDIFVRRQLSANDTSAAVGYAPLTETERCVLATERHLNSTAMQTLFPEIGEDVKVMGYRLGRHLSTVLSRMKHTTSSVKRPSVTNYTAPSALSYKRSTSSMLRSIPSISRDAASAACT